MGDKSTKEEHNILMADELQERDLQKNSEILSMGCDQIYQGTVEYLGWGVTRDLPKNSGVLSWGVTRDLPRNSEVLRIW